MLCHSGTIRIESERLILRRFLLGDAPAVFYNWTNDSAVSLYMRWQPHIDADKTREMIERWISQYSNPSFYQWGIELREDHTLVGAIGLFTVNENDCCADVGYCVGRRYWGRGIAAEALSAVLYFAFAREGYNRVEAYHAANNPASGRVMEKAGMRYEGFARAKYRSNRAFEDSRMYAVLRDDLLQAEYSHMKEDE
ncbi:MAG: GNAT family N-acetyltransferase [Acetanaerobacterium sp.]